MAQRRRNTKAGKRSWNIEEEKETLRRRRNTEEAERRGTARQR